MARRKQQQRGGSSARMRATGLGLLLMECTNNAQLTRIRHLKLQCAYTQQGDENHGVPHPAGRCVYGASTTLCVSLV